MTFPRASAPVSASGPLRFIHANHSERALESGVYLLSEKALGDLRSSGAMGRGRPLLSMSLDGTCSCTRL